MLAIIAIFLVVFRGIEWIIKRKSQSEKAKEHSKTLRIIAQNLLFTYIYADAADVFLFSVLDFKTNNGSSKLNIINLVVSVMFIAITLAVIILHFIILRKYHRIRKNAYNEKEKEDASEEFKIKYRSISVLWQDFKEKSIFTHSFLLIAVVRDVIFSLVLALLYEYPLIQAVIIVTLSTIVMAHLVVFRPFEELKEAIQAYLCEIILFGVNICVLILAISDKNGSLGSDGREMIGRVVMIMCLVFNIIPLVFLAINVFLLIRESIRWFREGRSSHKIVPSSPTPTPRQAKEDKEREKDDEDIFEKFGRREKNEEEQKSFTSATSPPSMIQPQLNESTPNAESVRLALKNRIAKKLNRVRGNSEGIPLNVDLEENNTSRAILNKD